MVTRVVLQTLASWTGSLLGRDSGIVRRLRPLYEKLLDVSTCGRGFVRTVNGTERFYVHPRYRGYFPESYEPGVCDFLRTRVRPGAICLNAGAHVGVYALCLAEWSRPNGIVLAFEPNPLARAVLGSHVARNTLLGRIEVMPQALSDFSGEAILFAAGLAGFSRLGRPDPESQAAHTAIAVSVTTVDLVCTAKGIVPDCLVIDVEGYEASVLRGSRGTMGAASGIIAVVEMHPHLWSASASSRVEMEATLDELELQPVPLTGQADPLGERGVVRLERR
jgi:FkbM family methyltransferase